MNLKIIIVRIERDRTPISRIDESTLMKQLMTNKLEISKINCIKKVGEIAIFNSLTQYINCMTETNVWVIHVAIAAPVAPYFGIRK